MENKEKRNYPIIDVPSDGKPKWCGGARTMAFVYSKHKGNFIVRGFSHEVEEFLKKNFTHYFFYFSMWNNGRPRGIWKFWKENVMILEPDLRSKRNKRYKYEVYQTANNGRYHSFSEFGETKMKERQKLYFKRLPKQWIPEFDSL